MLDTSARLLELLSLLTSRRYWAGAELAERLAITDRTLRRDIERLRQLGYAVDSTSGVAGGYHLVPGRALPPLLLDREEALAVALGLRTAATSSVAGTVEAATRALAKLERVLPVAVRRKVETLTAAVAPLPFSGPVVDPRVLGILASACQDNELVGLGYTDRAGAESERVVEPHGVVCVGSRWYLAAWDRGRDAFRTFRLDRIASAVPEGKGFLRRALPGGSAAAYVSQSIASGQKVQVARILFHASEEDVSRRIPPGVGRIQALDEERCLFETDKYSLEHIALQVAMLGFEFEVLEPAELQATVRALAKRLARAGNPDGHAFEHGGSHQISGYVDRGAKAIEQPIDGDE